jgi:hypothetical protein
VKARGSPSREVPSPGAQDAPISPRKRGEMMAVANCRTPRLQDEPTCEFDAAALYRLMTWMSPAYPVGAFSSAASNGRWRRATLPTPRPCAAGSRPSSPMAACSATRHSSPTPTAPPAVATTMPDHDGLAVQGERLGLSLPGCRGDGEIPLGPIIAAAGGGLVEFERSEEGCPTGGGRPTCEGCKCLDVRQLHRKDLLRPGLRFDWSWIRNNGPSGNIGIMTEPGCSSETGRRGGGGFGLGSGPAITPTFRRRGKLL